MGCCVSTPKNNPLENNNSNNKNNINPHQFQCVSKSPPRAEEETVKEVLSETPKPRPKPKPKPRSRPESPRKRQVDVEVDEVREADDDEVESMMKPKLMVVTPKEAYLEQKTGNPYPDPSTPEEISEVSEICSFSETISTSTLKEEDDLHSNHHQHHQVYSSRDNTAASGEARQQRVFRSQGYNGNFQHLHYHHPQQQQHYRSQGKSPARRRPDPESSPARKRPPGPVTGPRREGGGDNPGRRSQSPAMRGNVGRSPSGRKTGPSPGRVRMVNGPESGRKVQEEDKAPEEEEEAGGGRRESEEWQGPNESLENPLVSLECFIFL